MGDHLAELDALLRARPGEDVVTVADVLAQIRPAWHAEARCKGRTDLFFSNSTSAQKAAVAICATCPVREPCRDAAEVQGEARGAWGGLTATERRKARPSAA